MRSKYLVMSLVVAWSFLAINSASLIAREGEIGSRISVNEFVSYPAPTAEIEKRAERVGKRLQEIEKEVEDFLNIKWSQSEGVLLFKSEKTRAGFKGVSVDNFKIVLNRGERSFYAGRQKDGQLVAGMSFPID